GWGSLVKNFFVNTFFQSHGKKPGGNWTGNSHFKGGLTYLHERGYELYDLPSGTKIYNHESSEQMVLETARQTAQGVINSMMKNKGDSDGNIIIPISIAGEEIDRVVVPRVSNRLALNTMRRRR
ncbi:MAG: phage tail tape measure protein, partial [Clostridium sp.]|nr:phage tail tape measure protein [Clostridium sp.]MDU1456474.1 phage tail tape measure protein [Paeniclostridium sordellii]